MIFWILLGIVAAQFSIVPILYSEYTSSSLIDFLRAAFDCSNTGDPGCTTDPNFQWKLYKVSNYSDLDEILLDRSLLTILDITASKGISTLINEYARKIGFIHSIVDHLPEKPLPYASYATFSYKSFVEAALSIAKNYKIKRAIAIISDEFIEMDFENNEGIEIVDQIIISEAASYEYIFWLFSKKIKPLGVKWFFFQTSSEISKLIQKALVEADMDKEGFTYIYMEEAAWGAYLEGSILLESVFWHSTDIYTYYNSLLRYAAYNIYTLIMTYQAQGSFSGYTLIKLLAPVLTAEYMGFTIWNIQDGIPKTVGFINGAGLKLYSEWVFPGGTKNSPKTEKIKIPISINEADYKNEKLNAVNQIGVNFAINAIKEEENYLSNFEIVVKNVSDCRSLDNLSYNCSFNGEDLGLFYISDIEAQRAQETMEIFKENNISTPVLGVETSTVMSNEKYYPQYARVSYSNSRTASAAALILSVFGIKKCSVLYTENQWGKDFMTAFVEQSQSYGIKILNKNRAVPLGFNKSASKIVQEIIDLKTRYVVLEVQQPDIFYIIEAFYDLGMRDSDIYLIVGDGMISFSDLDEKLIGSKSYNKRKEIMNGLIYISFLAFESQVGFDLKNQILSEYGYTHDYMCLFYDAAYLGLYTINKLISWGANYNSSSIQDSVRKVAFTGCSGYVRISQEGIDRLTTILGIYNLMQVNSNWDMKLCGVYDPGQLIALQIKQSISWNENGEVRSDIIGDDQECPFRDILVQSFFNGYIILIIIEVIPIIIGGIFTIKFYDFIFKQKYQKLIKTEKENFFDLLSYLMFLIETLQYMQVGPDFTNFIPKLSQATKSTTLDIKGYFRKGLIIFWNQVEFYEAISFLWFLLFLWKILKVGKNSNNSILVTFNELTIYIMPFIAELLFLPANLYLYETFQCTSSIGDDFKDSFNDHYCSTFCWQGEHITYSIISALAIFLYLPTSLYFRFTWKSHLPFHFQEQPFHIALKSSVQFIMVLLVTIVNPASEMIFIWLCIALMLIYVILSIIKKPLTYDRASLWYNIIISACLILWCSCALAKADKIAAFIVVIIGWIFLAIFGMIYQKLKLPCLLESDKGIDIHKLFRFQLSSISPEAAGISKIVQLKYIVYDNSPSIVEDKSPIEKSSSSFSSEIEDLKSEFPFNDANNDNS